VLSPKIQNRDNMRHKRVDCRMWKNSGEFWRCSHLLFGVFPKGLESEFARWQFWKKKSQQNRRREEESFMGCWPLSSRLSIPIHDQFSLRITHTHQGLCFFKIAFFWSKKKRTKIFRNFTLLKDLHPSCAFHWYVDKYLSIRTFYYILAFYSHKSPLS